LKIDGAVIAITGGAKGLGLCIAEDLVGKGGIVEVVDRDAELVATLPSEISGACYDVAEPEDVQKWIDGIVQNHGRIDILINNAGVIYNEPIVNILNPTSMRHDFSNFKRVITGNLYTTFLVTSHVVEHMVKLRTKGSIINISSISSAGNEGQTAYSAAKAGINSMTVTWAKELGRLGIRCNAIAPGFIDTPSTRASLQSTTIRHLESQTPLRRLGTPHDVAHAVISLIENDYINGVILGVDGGLRI
jgi:3-oxoacyl-[acyl-carrier protein] reductase